MNKLYKYYININNKIKKIMHLGFKFSLMLLILTSLILYTYKIYTIPILYYLGLSLFKLGLIYFVTFFCFGFTFNKLVEEI